MLANNPSALGKEGSCCLLGEVPTGLVFSQWDGGRGKL